MRIAVVAPLMESVPPKLYGGTERVASYLTEELVRQGHDVTLFASGDSVTRARLRAVVPQGLRLDPGCRDPMAYHVMLLDEVLRASGEFDVIHFHLDYLQFPSVHKLATPSVTTLHGRLDGTETVRILRRFSHVPVVSISHAQRAPAPEANWVATIYHGLPTNLLPFRPRSEGYLAFLGRISPEKRPDRAIAIARRAGVPLRIAAKVDRVDTAYFQERIRPLLAGPGVEFVGEISDGEKGAFLGGALGVLFPIDWPEPFGLVMIEALACGTPVIGYRCGSVPEIVTEGVTGFVVEDLPAAIACVHRLGDIDRRRCRERFERHFTVQRMASEYVATYRRVAEVRTATAA
ncbi:MAG TPA: glycosyltransferase family 4 protein [Burkholderiales bacterium]|nr:glycosyltransferase family 4 protein [Burkholderiales bacterium]